MSKTVLVNDISVTLAAGATSALIPHGIVEISGPKLPDDVYPDSASAIVCILKDDTNVQFRNDGAILETAVSFRVWRMHSSIRVPGVTYSTTRKWQGLGPNAGGGGGGGSLQAAYTAGGAGGGAIVTSLAGGPLSIDGTLSAGGVALNATGLVGATVNDAATVTSTSLLFLTHTSTGAAGIGFGVNIINLLENAAGATLSASKLDTAWATATGGNETSQWAVTLRNEGAFSGAALALSPWGLTVTQHTRTSGTGYQLLKTTSADLGPLTASVENIDVDFDMAHLVTFATGALAVQRAAVFRAPSYTFVGASTLTTAATVAITGAPIASAPATITNRYSLWVQDGLVKIDGNPSAQLTMQAADPAGITVISLNDSAATSRGIISMIGPTNATIGTLFGVAPPYMLVWAIDPPLVIGTNSINSLTLGSNAIARLELRQDAEVAGQTSVYISGNASGLKRIHLETAAAALAAGHLLLTRDA